MAGSGTAQGRGRTSTCSADTGGRRQAAPGGAVPQCIYGGAGLGGVLRGFGAGGGRVVVHTHRGGLAGRDAVQVHRGAAPGVSDAAGHRAGPLLSPVVASANETLARLLCDNINPFIISPQNHGE
ncbi:hypothetical protein NDU88_005950 [Pleurodeles waltl]|uniref:Uncharacterized protein n=1 Tax=Pleurodeles waltl TaxID=8319 RepID=A0AAV7RMK1_PLEWA|nr:hypothetical protein NDU88_005950 [Pleurodeles waltl]